MTIKQKFAKKVLRYDNALNNRYGKADKMISLLIAGAFGLIGGGIATEMQSMDDSIKPHAEIAMTEYTAALDALSAAKGDYKPGTPSPLQDLIGNSEDANRHLQNISGQNLETLSKKFGTALIIDERLNEQQAHELAAAFENRIGDFERFTGYDPDFSDLDEARKVVKQHATIEATALAIDESSRKDLLRKDVFFGGGAIGILLGAFMMAGIATNRRRLESWASEKPYKKQPQFKH